MAGVPGLMHAPIKSGRVIVQPSRSYKMKSGRKTTLAMLATLSLAAAAPSLAACSGKCKGKCGPVSQTKCGAKCGGKCAGKCGAKK